MSLRRAIEEVREKLEEDKKLDKEFSKLSNKAQTHANAEMRKGASSKDAIARAKKHFNEDAIEEATNMYTDDITGFQIDRFAGKKGPTFQINYGRGKGKHIQIPKSDMKRVIAQMTKAMNAK